MTPNIKDLAGIGAPISARFARFYAEKGNFISACYTRIATIPSPLVGEG
jgi:hypothetical protein